MPEIIFLAEDLANLNDCVMIFCCLNNSSCPKNQSLISDIGTMAKEVPSGS
jgi:hypothetical protein